jgi:hypothetical protein
MGLRSPDELEYEPGVQISQLEAPAARPHVTATVERSRGARKGGGGGGSVPHALEYSMTSYPDLKLVI